MSHCRRFVVVDFSAIASSRRINSSEFKVCVDLRVHRLRRNQAVYNANKYAKLVKQRVRLQNWFDYYVLKHQRNPHKKPTCRTWFLGLWGNKVDSIEYYQQQIKEFDQIMSLERQKVLKDSKLMLPVAFVSFDSRWGAAICAQTQQSKNPTLWLTSSAPEPRAIYWQNLAIPFISLTIRKLVIGVSVFALVFFCKITTELFSVYNLQISILNIFV